MPAASPERKRRRLSSVVAAACASVCASGAAVLLSGCGGGGDRVPSLRRLPLVPGLQTVTSQRVCNPGSNAYCALELVLRGESYGSSIDLQRAERLLLKRRGWKRVNAPVGQEVAAASPSGKLRVTYAAANMELEAVDLGWVMRSRRITLTLSKEIFDHQPAMAVLLQLGTN